MIKEYYYFTRKHYPLLLFGLVTAFFGNYGQSFFIAWFGESFLTDFELTNSEYGMVYSSATLVSGFIILYVGALLDKVQLHRFSLFTSAGLAVACFLLYFASSVWHLILAIFLLRFCGQGLMFHIAYTSMAKYFNQNRGKAIGVVGFGMPLGEAILPALAVVLIANLGWRETWLALGIFLLILYWPAMLALLKKAKPRLEEFQSQVESDVVQQNSWSRMQVIKDFRFWLLIPAVMAPAFIVTGIFIHQAVLLHSKQWSEAWFATCFVVYAFSHLKASLVIGSLVDKHSGKKLAQYYLLPMLAGVALLALNINFEIIALLFMFLTGLTIGASGPVIGSLWVETYGNQHIGAIRSMVTSIMVVSTAISPVLFGWLFDRGLSYEQMALLIIIYIISAWALMKVALRQTTNQE